MENVISTHSSKLQLFFHGICGMWKIIFHFSFDKLMKITFSIEMMENVEFCFHGIYENYFHFSNEKLMERTFSTIYVEFNGK